MRISIDVSTDKKENMITFEECSDYKCGADVTEGTFETDTCTLVIGARLHIDEENPEEYSGEKTAYAELSGHGFMTRHFLPYPVAAIVLGIARGLSERELRTLGATRIRKMN
jgi:hypothetical protein